MHILQTITVKKRIIQREKDKGPGVDFKKEKLT